MTATFSPDPAPALDPDAVAPAGTQTLMRGLAVVQAVAAGARDLKDICARIGVARSTTHRLASCLVQERYLRSLPGVGFVLGPKLIELGFQAREAFPMATLARPYLDELAALTGDTIHLAVRDNDEVLYLEKIPGKKGLEMRSRVGHRMPLAATGVGKALLLDAEEPQWKALYRVGAPVSSRAPGGRQTWEAFRDRVDAGHDAVVDPYGAEAVEEFFAVAVEAFFVSGVAFRREMPALYDLLSGYFRQDPAGDEAARRS